MPSLAPSPTTVAVTMIVIYSSQIMFKPSSWRLKYNNHNNNRHLQFEFVKRDDDEVWCAWELVMKPFGDRLICSVSSNAWKCRVQWQRSWQWWLVPAVTDIAGRQPTPDHCIAHTTSTKPNCRGRPLSNSTRIKFLASLRCWQIIICIEGIKEAEKMHI